MAIASAGGEFELIARFFERPIAAGSAVAVGIGDDCALIDLNGGAGSQLWAVTTDMLVERVHFLPDVDPASLGHKSLAVNLSDLAACGATPRAFVMSIALPTADAHWLDAFSSGLHGIAERYRCPLAGGDTTRSVHGVTISITAFGTVQRDHALLRSGACSGDDLWVSGELGDAALGLAIRRGTQAADGAKLAIERLERPTPRVELGQRLAGVASSAIDLSDGLLGDLQHVVQRSGVGARVDWPAIPRSSLLRQLPQREQQRYALAGGDDYELLFTADVGRRDDIAQIAGSVGVAVTRIGTMVGERIMLVDAAGQPIEPAFDAYQHFVTTTLPR